MKKKEKEGQMCYDFCPEGFDPKYCRRCIEKRDRDREVKGKLSDIAHGLK